MRIRPPSSTIAASTIPGLSRKAVIFISPLRTASTASLLQSGHRERVFLGTPWSIGWRCLRLRSGPGAHLGLGKRPSGKVLLIGRVTFQIAFAAAEKTSAVEVDMYRLLRDLRRRQIKSYSK